MSESSLRRHIFTGQAAIIIPLTAIRIPPRFIASKFISNLSVIVSQASGDIKCILQKL